MDGQEVGAVEALPRDGDERCTEAPVAERSSPERTPMVVTVEA